MSETALNLLLLLLMTSFTVLLLFNISRKLRMAYAEKYALEIKKILKHNIDNFLTVPDWEFAGSLELFVKEAAKKGERYLSIVDEYLMGELEGNPSAIKRKRLTEIAWKLNFPAACLSQIKSRNLRISALGSRRAGMYNVVEAIDDMVTALDYLSPENQLEILLGLTRMGKTDAIQKAFEKIKNSIIINERAVIEILSSFPRGKEKQDFFRKMIYSDTGYVAALFLKAVDKEMTLSLQDDIIAVLENGGKEVRAAAIRSLATLGTEAPVEHLVRAAQDSDWEIRALAVSALGAAKTIEASDALFKALRDQEWWVRQNAANALIRHSDYEPLFILTAESGDKFALDSVVSALDNVGNRLLLRSIRNFTTT